MGGFFVGIFDGQGSIGDVLSLMLLERHVATGYQPLATS